MTREALLWSNQLRHRQNCDVTNDFLNIKIHGSNLDVTKYLLKFTLNKSHLAAEHSTGKFRFISVQTLLSSVAIFVTAKVMLCYKQNHTSPQKYICETRDTLLFYF